jgi:serine/threonine-protein kinase CHEK2
MATAEEPLVATLEFQDDTQHLQSASDGMTPRQQEAAVNWAKLIPLDGALPPILLPRSRKTAVFGRSPTIPIPQRISHEAISATHFSITLDLSADQESAHGTHKCVLEDLSTNGTYVNNVLVGKQQKRILSNGDEISLIKGGDELRRRSASQSPQKAVAIPLYIYSFRDLSLAKIEEDLEATGFDKTYQIGNVLGVGHYGTVHLGMRRNGDAVAVKIVDKARMQRAKQLRDSQMLDEVLTLQKLSHPNIISIYDVFESQQFLVLVLEYCSGGELFDYVAGKGRMEEKEARQLLRGVFEAVAYMHTHSVAHRDLKPENALLAVNEAGEKIIKLGDFGLARAIGENQRMSTLCGTPAYLAPEVFRPEGATALYTLKVDMWSLGMLLFVCLAGWQPYDDSHVPSHGTDFASFTLPIMRLEAPWDIISKEGQLFTIRLLQVNPEERPSAQEALEDPWWEQPTVRSKGSAKRKRSASSRGNSKVST